MTFDLDGLSFFVSHYSFKTVSKSNIFSKFGIICIQSEYIGHKKIFCFRILYIKNRYFVKYILHTFQFCYGINLILKKFINTATIGNDETKYPIFGSNSLTATTVKILKKISKI